MTAHIEAKEGEIAKTVLMPGDPKRATMIANTYLENPKLVSSVRGMLAYTGTYKGKSVTVMSSGMGMPSIGIYAYELYQFYHVDTILRIGTAGAYDPDLKIFDVLLTTESYSDSSFAKVQSNVTDEVMYPSVSLNQKIKETAKTLSIPLKEGKIYSSDVFYLEHHDYQKMFSVNHCLATEMESFALFHIAHRLQKQAGCLLTISNHFVTGEETTSKEREQSLHTMIKLALESI